LPDAAAELLPDAFDRDALQTVIMILREGIGIRLALLQHSDLTPASASVARPCFRANREAFLPREPKGEVDHGWLPARKIVAWIAIADIPREKICAVCSPFLIALARFQIAARCFLLVRAALANSA
jgi:hypothetical protein